MRWLAVGLSMCLIPVAGIAGSGPGDATQQTPGRNIPYSVGRALPDRSGEWIRAAQIQMFNPGDLWEHVNGAAEQYLAYGFQDLATTRYTSDQTRTVVVATHDRDLARRFDRVVVLDEGRIVEGAGQR